MIESLTPLTDSEFQRISSLVYDKCGIHLTEQKKTLVAGRLSQLLRQLQLKSFTEYYEYLLGDRSGKALLTLIEKISTNHTFFFRESAHFDFLYETVLPELTSLQKKRHQTSLRIWSAGCSSGEEPYMLAILLLRYFGQQITKSDTGVLATDISRAVLEKAKSGIYAEDNVTRMPRDIKAQYFKQVEGGQWTVADRVKEIVLFRSLNLMRPAFPFKKKFQAIFCRNVMIYFDSPTKKALIKKFFENTAEGGYLFIGHSETLDRKDCPYKFVRPAVYRKELPN